MSKTLPSQLYGDICQVVLDYETLYTAIFEYKRQLRQSTISSQLKDIYLFISMASIFSEAITACTKNQLLYVKEDAKKDSKALIRSRLAKRRQTFHQYIGETKDHETTSLPYN